MKKLLLAVAATAFLSACGVLTYSEGDRAGVVTKLSKKGVVCKTWEGELLMGGINQFAAPAANVFHFSVVDENIVDDLKVVMEQQKPVRLTYKQVLLPWFCDQQTEYQIVGVTIGE